MLKRLSNSLITLSTYMRQGAQHKRSRVPLSTILGPVPLIWHTRVGLCFSEHGIVETTGGVRDLSATRSTFHRTPHRASGFSGHIATAAAHARIRTCSPRHARKGTAIKRPERFAQSHSTKHHHEVSSKLHRNLMRYSAYGCASWYVTKIEGFSTSSTVES